MATRTICAGVLAAAIAIPASVLADESPTNTVPSSTSYYSSLEDMPLRRDITNLGHYYFIQSEKSAADANEFIADAPFQETQNGSAGGYVSFASPATSTFFGAVPADREDSFIDGVEFGVGWRPDVGGGESRDQRRLGHGFSGSEVDRVGLRADLTASLRDENAGDGGPTAWRVTGMLGSTSLSLLSPDNGLSPASTGSGLLWDIGVGWSSGAMSVNAGYQAGYGPSNNGEDGLAIGVLSLGADYSILPGLSVYGEFNVIDGPPDENDTGLGTVIIVGTGVSF